MALLRLMTEAAEATSRRNLVVVHYNHRLRGEDSAEDARFVKQLCLQLRVECCQAEAAGSLLSDAPGGQGLEAIARKRRYQFFEQVAREKQARYLVTAHQRDDQVETILHRIVRGTGVGGLGGIAPARQWLPGVGLVRPLLPFARSEIVEYLRALGQSFRHDVTNDTTQFTRNQLRNEVLPYLREALAEPVDQSLIRLAQQARECQEVIDHLVHTHLPRCVLRQAAAEVWLQAVHLARLHPYLVREILVTIWKEQQWPRQEMSQAHWHQLAELACGDAGKPAFTLPGAVQASRSDDKLVLQRPRAREMTQ